MPLLSTLTNKSYAIKLSYFPNKDTFDCDYASLYILLRFMASIKLSLFCDTAKSLTLTNEFLLLHSQSDKNRLACTQKFAK